MMNKLIIILTLLLYMKTSEPIIFDFTKNSDISSWRIVDDGVMGGRSQGSFQMNEEGNLNLLVADSQGGQKRLTEMPRVEKIL